MKVTSLFEYPVKGLHGNGIKCAGVGKRGLAMDRRWMLIDQSGNFLSQRQLPTLTHFSAKFEDELHITHLPTGDEWGISLTEFSNVQEVVVWGQKVQAHLADENINAPLSEYLKMPVRLAYMDEEDHRLIKGSEEEDIVSFADGYPILLTTEASLADLNAKLDLPVLMDRFRPNIVIDGLEPFAEDNWPRLMIGEVKYRVAKRCARCHVINIDQQNGQSTKEPLKTLSTFREWDNKVYFGINLIPTSVGIIHLGDKVTVL